MSGSMSFLDKHRKYEEMLKKIQNPGDPSVCGSMLDSRLGITNNRIDSTLTSQRFYGSASRSSKQSSYKNNENSRVQNELSLMKSTKANEYHSTTMGNPNGQGEVVSMSQKSYTQTYEKSNNEFCSAPSTSGSLQYPPSESFVFKLPVSTKTYKSTKDSWALDKYLTRINLNLKLVQPEDKLFMKFMASLVEQATVYYSSIQQGNGIMQGFNYQDMFNAVGQIFLQKYGVTSGKKAFSDVSSVTTNSTFYNNDLRPPHPSVVLQRAPTEVARSRAPSQVSSRRSQSHSPRREKTMSQRRLSNQKRSLSQESEEREDVEESNLSLFSANNSRIAQLRDQQALLQAQAAAESVKQPAKRRSRDTAVKPTPLPKSKSNARTNTTRDRKVNLTLTNSADNSQKQTTSFEVPTGAKAVTRTGRAVKSPVKWWGQGKNESKLNSTVTKKGSSPKDDETAIKQGSLKSTKINVLDDSIVLRNSKIVGKSPTDLEISKQLTSLTTTTKLNEKPAITKNKGKKTNEEKENVAKKYQRKKKTEDKENVSLQKKSQKGSKSSAKKTEEVLQERKGKSSKPAEKKTIKKRKSEEHTSKDAKRKKCEDQLGNLKMIGQQSFNSSGEDDIFGNAGYMKSSRPFIATAVSPTTGMLSAKKDAAAFLSKETPPCKAITQFMNTTCQSAASSYHQGDTAKQDAVVKRVTKKVKTQKSDKPESKSQNQAKREVNKKVTSTLPPTSLDAYSISVVLGNDVDQDSDESVFNEDDDLI